MDERRKHGWPFWFAIVVAVLPILYAPNFGIWFKETRTIRSSDVATEQKYFEEFIDGLVAAIQAGADLRQFGEYNEVGVSRTVGERDGLQLGLKFFKQVRVPDQDNQSACREMAGYLRTRDAIDNAGQMGIDSARLWSASMRLETLALRLDRQ